MKKYIAGAVILGFAGLVSLAFAEDTTNRQDVNNKPMVSRTPRPEATLSVEAKACMQNAVDKRDSAIILAVDTFSSSIKSALSTRKDAFKAAWGQSNKVDIRLGLRTAWDAYSKSAKEARRALNAARKAAWTQYRTDARACKPSVEDKSNEGADTQL